MLRAKTEKRPVRLWTFLTLLVVILVVLIFAERARLPVGSAAKPTAGYLYFLSSGQMSDTSNQGIADQVSLKCRQCALQLRAKATMLGYCRIRTPQRIHSFC